MGSIAIFCDGTWNNRDWTENDTSVARMCGALEAQGAPGVKALYIEGVGADDGPGFLGKSINKMRGGALGRGLTANIREGYAFICAHYKVGDKIFIFGFSRGAYTARSLAGLIRASGLMRDPQDINRAMHRYRDRADSTNPRTDESHEFRAEKSPDFYTNDTEKDWRARKGKTIGAPITIAYLGIFDTVGTHGIPGVLGQLRLIPGGHGFHDLELSSMVQSGRHAIGLDERRRLYTHTEWSNLPTLNREMGRESEGGARFRQEWFPGDHGMIGGSGADRRISNAVMGWILDGARVAGLDIKVAASLRPKPDDHKGPLSNTQGGDGLLARFRGWRDGPDHTAVMDVNVLALRRAREMAEYRPKSLKLLNFANWTALADQEVNRRIT